MEVTYLPLNVEDKGNWDNWHLFKKSIVVMKALFRFIITILMFLSLWKNRSTNILELHLHTQCEGEHCHCHLKVLATT